MKPMVKKCVICGKEMVTIHANKKYCSRSCELKGRTVNKHETQKKIKYVCKKCKKTFADGESGSKFYCAECFEQMKGKS